MMKRFFMCFTLCFLCVFSFVQPAFADEYELGYEKGFERGYEEAYYEIYGSFEDAVLEWMTPEDFRKEIESKYKNEIADLYEKMYLAMVEKLAYVDGMTVESEAEWIAEYKADIINEASKEQDEPQEEILTKK